MTTTSFAAGERMYFEELLDAIDAAVEELGTIGACSRVNQLFTEAFLTIPQHVEALAHLRSHGYEIQPPGRYGPNVWVSDEQFI